MLKMKSRSCENLLNKKIDYNQLNLPLISSNINLKQSTSPKNNTNKDTFYKKTTFIDELPKKTELEKLLITNLNFSKLNSRNRNYLNLKSNYKFNNRNTFNMNNSLNFKKYFPHISGLINRKEINNIPICPNLLITYKNKYANYSEYKRFIKFNEELLKLRAQINLDSKNTFKYLKEFMRYYGITNEYYYKNNFLCNFNNFVKSNFVNIINPNFSLQQNIINALINGGIVNTGFKEEEKVFISPFIKEEKEPKIFDKMTNNIKKKIETMCIVSLEKQQKLNKRLE